MSALSEVYEVEPYEWCRCERTLVCSSCLHAPEDCDCSNVRDDEAEELVRAVGEDDLSDLDPLTRTLLGLPSGIHCHSGDACLSGHCEVSS